MKTLAETKAKIIRDFQRRFDYIQEHEDFLSSALDTAFEDFKGVVDLEKLRLKNIIPRSLITVCSSCPSQAVSVFYNSDMYCYIGKCSKCHTNVSATIMEMKTPVRYHKEHYEACQIVEQDQAIDELQKRIEEYENK